MSKLYILRGIPGSGKSTYGKKIVDSAHDAGFSAIKFEADDFFMKDGKYNWNPKLIGMAHKWCQNSVRKALDVYDVVVVANTNLALSDINVYINRSTTMKVIAVYTPNDSRIATSIALDIGKLLSGRASTLFISLDGMSVIPDITGIEFDMDMSDLFCENMTEGGLSNAIIGSVRRLGNMDILPIMHNYQDMASVTNEEWKNFIRDIERKSDYEYVVIDLTESVRNLFDILKLANYICVAASKGTVDGYRYRQFMKEIEILYDTELKERINTFFVDVKSEIVFETSAGSMGPFGNYSRQFVSGVLM